MLGFHRRHHSNDLSPSLNLSTPSSRSTSNAQASTSKQVWQPQHDNRHDKTDTDLLVFLPTLNCVALPDGFAPPLSLLASASAAKGKKRAARGGMGETGPDPTLLAFYGTQQQAVKAISTAASLIDLSRLKESLWDELDLDDDLTELTMTMDPPTLPNQRTSQQPWSAGWLVRVTVYLKGQDCPDFAATGGRWTTCGANWRYNSPLASLGSIYVEFIA
ncbi:hypothetical protein ACM66B_000562 [Microbotryomycetes sp. NB124-2]